MTDDLTKLVAQVVGQAMQPLVAAIVASRPEPRPDLLGVVTGTGPLMVAVGGESVPVHLPTLGSYTPSGGDLVVIRERAKGDLVVIGKAVA